MPSPPVHDRPSGLALYRRAFAEARPFWPHLAGVLLLGLSALPLALLLPIPVKIVVDTVLGGHPLDPALARFIPDRVEASADGLLVTAALLGTVFPALMALHHFADWSFRDWLAERMVLDFRTRLLRKGLDCPHANADRGSQDATHRIQHDAPALQWTALYGIIPVVTCLASLAGVVTVTAMIDPVLAGTAVATAIPVLGIVHFGQSRLGDRWARAKDAEAGAFAIIQEVLANARLISTFGKADWEAARFGTHGADAVRQRHRIVRVEASLAMLISVTIGMGAAAVLFLGTRSVLSGTLTVGDLLVVIGYLAQLFAPVQQIGTHITGQQRALVSAARAFALMDAEAALPERPDARALGRAVGRAHV